ncbi:hypothetical protein AF332_06690 [Sporosarcina globispora]|uniref:Uncharacterized protein n=2 Tax=Sporosarcina globispora TaxID=1459 RepID=A0A0M0GKB1_SPOGL|nr:hypothetical protein AF332_06690 [Sporosarcina globispora]
MIHQNGQSICSEQIRMIRTYIDHLYDSESKLLMVTSPSDEGQKSIISSKLAIAFVEQGNRVLLADANIRSPSLHHWFQLKNENGFSNAIMHEENILLTINETLIPNLFVMPSGPIPLNPSEIWIASKIKEMTSICRTEFDVVIFEAPPILTASDSQVLANYCDGTILVVKENKTKKEDVLKTKMNLERKNSKILGVIYQTG